MLPESYPVDPRLCCTCFSNRSICFCFAASCALRSSSCLSFFLSSCWFIDSMSYSCCWRTNYSWNCDPLMLLKRVCGCTGWSRSSASLAFWIWSVSPPNFFFRIPLGPAFGDVKLVERPTLCGYVWLIFKPRNSFATPTYPLVSMIINLQLASRTSPLVANGWIFSFYSAGT